MNEERMKVLQMLQEGKLSIEEAMRLLEAMESPAASLVATTQPAVVQAIAQPTTRVADVAITPYVETGVVRRRDPAIKLGLNLEGALLEGANLAGARLLFANLEGVDFRHANLEDVWIVGANLEHANFAGANLQGARLLGVNLDNADFQGADLRNLASRQTIVNHN